METIQHPHSYSFRVVQKKAPLFTQFLTWCKSQEQYRFGWLAAIIAGHGCLITPLTLFFVVLAGNNPVLWVFTMAAMGISLVSNLAALPTKFTIPIFFFSILMDVMIIINCIALIGVG